MPSELDLNYKKLTLDGLTKLLLEKPEGWTSLLLEGNHFGDAGAALLANWPGIARAEVLNLANTEIGPQGLAALAASPHARPVEFLLDENPLGDEAIIPLAASPILSRVRYLGLSCTGIDHAGVEALVRSPHLSELATIELVQTELLGKSWNVLKQRFAKVER